MAGSDEATGAWLHGIVPRLGAAVLDGVTGMAGGRLSSVRSAGLTAVVSDVPLSGYGEEPLRRNLEDLAWLERAARDHHVVVEALSKAGPVVPARLATVYLSRERVASALAERRAEFTESLNRVTGRAEWGVKAYRVETMAAAVAEPAARSGTAYLARRRAQLIERSEGLETAAREASAVHASLAHFAAGARRHAPQDRRLSGTAADMVLNGAYLVDDDRVNDFVALVSALSKCQTAVRLDMTGPWPPYSFIGPPTGES